MWMFRGKVVKPYPSDHIRFPTDRLRGAEAEPSHLSLVDGSCMGWTWKARLAGIGQSPAIRLLVGRYQPHSPIDDEYLRGYHGGGIGREVYDRACDIGVCQWQAVEECARFR